MDNFTTTTTMNNFTSFESSSSSSFLNQTSTKSLDQLLDQLGFSMWETVVDTFILPSINLVGVALCSFSFWIFSRPAFKDPIFFYYKLLCFVNILLLMHNIPFDILFTPRYFPMINTYALSVFQIYYIVISNVLFHYGDVLQMGILLTKMKLYSPFVSRNFTARPQIISLLFFLTCLFIDSPFAFSFKIVSFESYFYFDLNGVKKTATLYQYVSSEFTSTPIGKFLLVFTEFFLNLFLSLLVGTILNFLSYIKYKYHLRQKLKEAEELQMSSIHNKPTTCREIEQQSRREKREHRIERNMFYMALTLCSISIVSRVLIVSGSVYLILYFSLTASVTVKVIENHIYTLVPTMSIFVYYMFNKMFRDETNRKLFGKEPRSNH